MAIWSAITNVCAGGAAALAEALEGAEPSPYAVGSMEIEDGGELWEVAAWFEAEPDAAALALAAAAFGARPFIVSVVPEQDWVRAVQRELAPVRAGRFLVHGSHDRAAASGLRHALEIEAALAFGTGHHGTTRGCLHAIDLLARSGFRPRRVADIGAGTGVLAMGAASLWRVPAIASDIDETARETTRANAAANRLGPWLRALRAPGFASPALRAGAPYDLILANILANPLKRLAPEMRRHVAPGGVLILSGILNGQAVGVEAVYRGWGFRRLRAGRDGEWTTLTLRA